MNEPKKTSDFQPDFQPDCEATLTAAYEIAKEAGQPLAAETACIRCFFLTPECIGAIGDEALYLSFLRRLFAERFNISFSENASDYEKYLADCVRLKDSMEGGAGHFRAEAWLDYAVWLLENLKTPYYETYARSLLSFRSCFTDDEVFAGTLRQFYSVMIRSTPEKLALIRRIAQQSLLYKMYLSPKSILDEAGLAALLADALALFTNEKEYWLPSVAALIYGETVPANALDAASLLEDFFAREEKFLKELAFEAPAALPFPGYLAKRRLWFLAHPANRESRSFHKAPCKSSAVDSEFLNTYAYDMTAEDYPCDPAIGRERELSDLALILISPKKSPILVGEAGVGKTSLVEGLCRKIQAGDVPDRLRGKHIFKLTTTSLLAGTKYVGEMEERMKTLTDELRRRPEVILFLDEIHTIVGAGSTESSNNDIANMLKPFIDRGAIKVIGATTREEYERFLLPDRALSRRFYPIAVAEPDEALTLRILKGTVPAVERETGVKNCLPAETLDPILEELIRLSRPENQPEDLPTRRPELPLTLLEMAFSYAALDRRDRVAPGDFVRAVRHSSRLRQEVRDSAELFSILPRDPSCSKV